MGTVLGIIIGIIGVIVFFVYLQMSEREDSNDFVNLGMFILSVGIFLLDLLVWMHL